MQKRKTSNLDQRGTSEQERAQTTAKAGQKGYSRKSNKASSQSRDRSKSGKAGGKKQQSDRQGTAYKYTSEDVSRIVQRRTKELRNRLNDLKAENEVLREILITSFKEWYEERGVKNGKS